MTGTDRATGTTSSPTVHFILAADEISNDATTNTHVVRCYARSVNFGNTTTWYGTPDDASVTVVVNGQTWTINGSNARLSPSGFAAGYVWWEYTQDFTVTGNSDGTAIATVSITPYYPRATGTGTGGSDSFALTTLILDPPDLQRWNGTAWANQQLERWNGTAWHQQILERWNGTAWVRED